MSDLIERQAVLDLTWEEPSYTDALNVLTEIRDKVKELPSIIPTERTAHWIEKDGYDGDTYYDCSECGESWTTIDGTPWNNGMNYCPNCGARMIDPQESEVSNDKRRSNQNVKK